MKIKKFSQKPSDIKNRIGAKPIVCYPNTNIEEKNLIILHSARENLVKKEEVIIPVSYTHLTLPTIALV